MISGVSLTQLILLLVISLVPARLSNIMAKDKGRNVGLWTVLGLIPGLNLLFLLFLIAATNLRLEGQLERIIALLEATE